MWPAAAGSLQPLVGQILSHLGNGARFAEFLMQP
jgi:hypothetical protein